MSPRTWVISAYSLMSALLVSSAFLAYFGPAQAATQYFETTFHPESATSARTAGTTKVDNRFSQAEVRTENCGIGTCKNTNSWNVGLSAQKSVNANLEVVFSYDLAGSGITAGAIRNLTFAFGGCWHGGADQSCGNKSNIEFKAGGSSVISIWDGGSWESLGQAIKIGNKASSSLDSYKEFKRTKSSGFGQGHLDGDMVRIKIKTTGFTASDHDVIQVFDYASITIGHDENVENRPPVAESTKTVYVEEGGTVLLDASASRDPDGDLLNFHWSQVGGPPVTLQDADGRVARFTAPQVSAPTGFAFEVRVSDGEYSDSDVVVAIAKEQLDEKPNVIIFLTDDQRWDTIQYMPTVMSRIADQGALFTNAFASLPLCCPSRATFLTGQYAHNHEVWKNITPMGGMPKFNDTSSLATWLDNEGYRTGIVGKYMNSYTKLIPYVAKGWDTWNVVQEVFYYNYTLVDDGAVLHYGDDPEDYQTDVLRDRALEFLRNGDGEPFFLYVGFPAPHTDVKWRYPLMPPRHEGTCEQYPDWRPPSYNETDISDKPAFLQFLAPMDAAKADYIDKFRNDQICSLKATDEAIAAIMDEVGPELDNTVVIFASDNGFFWGEHRMEGKFNLYDEAIRIPLAIRYPPLIEPQVRTELVSNIDIAPTISEMSGSPPNPPMKVDGTSLTELFVMGDDYWRDHILIEQIRFGNQTGVRTLEFKYIENLQDDGEVIYELYDLRTDPYELDNVAANPGYSSVRNILASMLAEIRDD